LKNSGQAMTIEESAEDTRTEHGGPVNKEISQEELSKHDGKGGNLVYIACRDRVIDVSQSPLWPDGLHMGRHQAGKDLTIDLESAPHGPEVLDRYPQVGVLEKKERPADVRLPPAPSGFLDLHPFFRRHPHPMTVHFPIVLTLAASFFSLLRVVSGEVSFGQTAFYCLVGALLFMVPAIGTGVLSWWINYMARPLRSVRIKMTVSIIMVPVMLFLVLWQFSNPYVLDTVKNGNIVFLALVIALSAAVLVVAYYGGMLVFPIEKRAIDSGVRQSPSTTSIPGEIPSKEV
jgi:predicted heme/steroid binding protein/uncharacterized membrane protein